MFRQRCPALAVLIHGFLLILEERWGESREHIERQRRLARPEIGTVTRKCSLKHNDQPGQNIVGAWRMLSVMTSKITQVILVIYQEQHGVAPLMNKDGFLQSYPTKKAEILNQQFQSVYTKEDPGSIPDKGPSPYSSMENIKVNPNGVKKLLKDIRPFKASGPDGIPTFLLRAAAEELAPMLIVIRISVFT